MARKETYCPVEATLDLIGNKWKVLILREVVCWQEEIWRII